MKLKVLPLESYWDWMDDDELERYEPAPELIGRPGWYWDRPHDTCWVELPDHRGAYYTTPSDFRFRLKLLSHVRLTPRERFAIQELINMGSCPRVLSERLREDDYALQLRDTVRGAKRFFLKRG